MTLTVTRTGRPMSVNLQHLVKVLQVEAVARIQRRTASGTDIRDRPFEGYSAGYVKALLAGGEGTSVDLTLTGALLKSVQVIRTVREGRRITIVIAPGTGTSPAVSLAKGRARRTGGRSTSHNVVGYHLHHGTPHMRARPWLALSPKDRARMRAAIYRASLVRGGG
jgi:hypothetical protein